METTPSANSVRFGPFRLDLKANELHKDGRRIRLQGQPFKVLKMLLEHPGEVVSREEIRQKLWPNDTVVEFDHSINAAIKKLRSALGDSAEQSLYVETVARLGYRLLVSVEWGGVQAATAVGTPLETEAKDGNLIGKRVSHYRILSVLGGGGMGVVYSAEDLKLGRRVALKFLPEELGNEASVLKRFEREARAASALDHPNICTIYGVEEHDGQPFIAMQLLDGETLRERIGRSGAMPTNELLDLAMQIATGLEAAHEKGIIHRDIKPANIFVTTRGQVKILDFGLAKLQGLGVMGEGSESDDSAPQKTGSDGIAPGPSSSSNLSLSASGQAMGTTSYMSPEQVRRDKLDTRTDLFSFGLVLYEMTTGRQVFVGESVAEVHEAILNVTPIPVDQLNLDLPVGFADMVNRALEKDRESRYQTASDLRSELQRLKWQLDSGSSSSTVSVTQAPAVAPRSRTLLERWPLILVGILAALLGVSVWFYRSTTKVPEASLIAVPLTSYPGEERQPSFSPDGNQVAFSWDGEKEDNFDIYVKLIGSGTQLRVTTASEADSCPAWSPDGRSIAFIREGPGGKDSVYLVSPLGPPERKVAEVSQTGMHWLRGLVWTPDGKSLIVTDRNSDSEPSGLFWLSVESGERRRLTSPPEKVFVDGQPAFSPDGRTLAFIRAVAVGVDDIYLLTLSEDFQPIGEPKRLTFENQLVVSPVWTLDGREIIFSSGQYLNPSLFRIAVSGSAKPQRLAGFGEDGSWLAISHRARRLVYTRELIDGNIWRLEVPGPHGKISSPMKLISSTRVDEQAQFSPNGKKIVFSSNRTGSFEIWICDSDGSHAHQLTSLGVYSGGPHWSPDGERIAFSSKSEGRWDIFVTGASGGKPTRLTSDRAADFSPLWSRDGRWIYFASNRSGEYQVWKAPAGGGEALRVTRKGGFVALESPDGQWMYYTKSVVASSLWRVPRDGGEETQVLESVFEGAFALVSEGIYFIPKPDSAGRHSIQFFNFATKKTRSITTIERPVGSFLSVSPDGRWILYSQTDQSGSDLMLVENFR